MVAEINNSPAAVADGRTPDEIAAEFVHRFRLDTPDLTEGAISMDVEEVQVDVFRFGETRTCAMNSSTGIPLSTATFLKACSDISGLAGAA